MQNFANKTAWITGASAGIGAEMARQLSALGTKVVLSARNEGKLREVQQTLTTPEKSLVLPLDMEAANTFPERVKTVQEQMGQVNLLFLNAGISQRSNVRETAGDVDRKLMEVNYFGAVAFTKALLPHLPKGAHIAVNTSLSGKFGFYQRSAYAASKFALHGFFETLRLEEDDLKVTLLCPAGIKTGISENALDGSGQKFGQSSALQEEGMPVETCVKKMLSAIRKEKTEVIIGQGMEPFSVKIKALFPRLFWKMLRKRKPE